MNNKILVIGDACIDQYVYGYCRRLNPESAAPLLTQTYTETKFGMALNVAENIRAFGVDCDVLVPEQKSVKTRYIDLRNSQQLLRMDQDVIVTALEFDDIDLSTYSVIVVSDYNKGYVSDALLYNLDCTFSGTVFVDSKKTNLGVYRNLIFKINQLEQSRLTSTPDNLIVTLGDRGAEYQGQIYPTRQVHVNDVCGAGDMFISALSVKYLKTQNIIESIKYANLAAGISVQHTGVYVLTPDDVKELNYA